MNSGTAAAAARDTREKRHIMTIKSKSHGRMTITEVEEFLAKPPPGFSVETLGSGYRVRSDSEKNLVLIDDFDLCKGKVVFQNSMGRWGKSYAVVCIYTKSLSDLCSISGKLKCTICGSTPGWERVYCPRRSISWCLPAKKTSQWPTEAQPVKPEVTVKWNNYDVLQ